MTSGLFSRRAGRELRDAAKWIAGRNPEAAETFVKTATDAARRLSARPGLGRVMTAFVPERYRFWSVRGFPYLLVYDTQTIPPHVVRVVHMARDLPEALRDLDLEEP